MLKGCGPAMEKLCIVRLKSLGFNTQTTAVRQSQKTYPVLSTVKSRVLRVEKSLFSTPMTSGRSVFIHGFCDDLLIRRVN